MTGMASSSSSPPPRAPISFALKTPRRGGGGPSSSSILRGRGAPQQQQRQQPQPSAAVRAAFGQEEEEDEDEQRRLVGLCFPQQQQQQQQPPQQQQDEEKGAADMAQLASSLEAAAVDDAPAAASPPPKQHTTPGAATAAAAALEAKEARADALKERGNVRAEAGDMAGALQLFEEAIGVLGPTTSARGQQQTMAGTGPAGPQPPHDALSARLWDLKAQCHQQLEEYLEAVRAAERAVELSGARWPEARLTLGRSLLQFGEVRAAVRVLTELFGADPSNEEVRADLIEANAVLSELLRREADFDLQLSGRAGLDATELEVCLCKRNLLARGKAVDSDCTLGMDEEEEAAVALDRARREGSGAGAAMEEDLEDEES
jgi:tetratricopeptide (TPR) repeat protein